MSRFDMSELSESHSVARLVGAPPGYVGYEAGGHLTEALRARPYQVLLLDEIEKAHPKVHMLLLQILEEGRLTDGRGRAVDFRHAVIIMTSNLGVSALGAAKPIGFATHPAASPAAGTATLEAARASLPPELWNRFDEVLYYSALSAEEVAEVARLMLRATAQRLEREKGILLDFDPSVVELLLHSGGYDPTLGARPMRRAVQRLVEAPLAEAVLRGETGPQGRWRLVVRQGRVEAVVAGEAAR
jgi:ATP-dependent Clp protease ATP-binding subunit ClpC